MEKIIDAALGIIEIAAFSSIIGFGSYKGLQVIHNKMRDETINALKKPTPSLLKFSQQLTNHTN